MTGRYRVNSDVEVVPAVSLEDNVNLLRRAFLEARELLRTGGCTEVHFKVWRSDRPTAFRLLCAKARQLHEGCMEAYLHHDDGGEEYGVLQPMGTGARDLFSPSGAMSKTTFPPHAAASIVPI